MKRAQATFAICIAIAGLAGCASQVLDRKQVKTYAINQRLQAPVGGAFLRIETGEIQTVRRWVGILNSPDGWHVSAVASRDYRKGELVYGGISGRTIEVSYREYRSDLAAPAFYQQLKYDLSASPYIVFQNFRLEVLSATNAGIDAVLVSDGS